MWGMVGESCFEKEYPRAGHLPLYEMTTLVYLSNAATHNPSFTLSYTKFAKKTIQGKRGNVIFVSDFTLLSPFCVARIVKQKQTLNFQHLKGALPAAHSKAEVIVACR